MLFIIIIILYFIYFYSVQCDREHRKNNKKKLCWIKMYNVGKKSKVITEQICASVGSLP